MNSEKEPLVSVVMPVYNSEKYLQRAIDSVFNQSYKNYEFIIIDDGSTDGSVEIINEYKNKIVYVYQENAGASAARNKGIEVSKGELIAFLDSDDLWYPDKLKIQVNVYHRYPEASIIHTEVDKQKQFNGYLPTNEQDLLPRIKPFSEVFQHTNLKTPSVMIPRSVLDRVGLFDTSLPTAEDKDLFLRCSYQQQVVYIPAKLAYCSVFPGSLCDDLRSYHDNLKVIDRFLKLNPEFIKKNQALVNKVKSEVYYDYAEDLCFKNKCLEAAKAAVASNRYRLNVKAISLLFKSYLKYFVLIFKSKN